MKIGIDIDEVIVKFIDKFLEFYNQKKNTNFKFNDFNTYDFWDIVGGTKEEAIKLVYEFCDSDLIDGLELLENAKEGVDKLNNEHEIIIITARSPKHKEKTFNFFDKYFPGLKEKIIFSRDGYGGKVSKEIICKENNIELMIEDHKNYSLTCAENGIKVLLLDKPWNQNVEHENIIRVNNWNEIINKIEVMKND